jgi:hypothetical protein
MLDTSAGTFIGTTTGPPVSNGDQGFSQWSWYSQDGTLYSLYLCDWPAP